MCRIYIDTNIYSNLESNELPTYQQLNALLKEHKHKFTFFFSPAHIRDKRKADGRKVDYFKFIEQFVGDNHITYHTTERITSHYLATPTMVFNDDIPDLDISELFQDSNESDSSLQSQLSIYRNFLFNLPIPIDPTTLDQVEEAHKTMLSKFLPIGKEVITAADVMKQLLAFWQEISVDYKPYKELRSYIFDGINKGLYNVDNNEIDFNETLKDSVLQKSFLEYARDTIQMKDKNRIPYYDYYLHCYCLLDILGISKDEIKKRNSFNNIFNDSLHSYYAQYNDYLVTEDKGLARKSKALYSLLGIHTQVVNVKEFIDLLPNLITSCESTGEQFFKKIENDILNGSKSEPELYENTAIITISIRDRYLNFFDKMLQVILLPSNQSFIVLVKENQHHLSMPNYREREAIVNMCIDLFGNDAYNTSQFNFEEEIEQMKNDIWGGRHWLFGSMQMSLHINKESNEFCLQLGAFNSTVAEE